MIEPILDRYLAAVLKQHDFRRKGRLWNRQLDAISHVLHVQSGRWSTGTSGYFTVNLGVFLPSAYQAIWGKPPPKWARDVDCAINVRIGQVMAEGTHAINEVKGKRRDYWWDSNESTDMERVGREFADAVTGYALPFLGQFSSLIAVHDFLGDYLKDKKGGEPYAFLSLAVLKYHLGDEDSALHLLQSANERFPGWRDRTQETIARLETVLTSEKALNTRGQ